MSKTLLPAFAGLCAVALFACKPNSSAPTTPSPVAQLKYDNREVSQKHCEDKASERCVEFKVGYPVFSGGDSLVANGLNKSIQSYLMSVLGGKSDIPFSQALDSSATAFVQMYIAELRENPDLVVGFATEINHKLPLLNRNVVTVEMNGYTYTGGAHPTPFSSLVSYQLAGGVKPLSITDLVQDTNALRPILEKGYKLSKDLKETDALSELVYPEIKEIPMPGNVGVTAEGIRFFYNAYEIAPYAVGPGDVLLTWAELGTLADRKKWVE